MLTYKLFRLHWMTAQGDCNICFFCIWANRQRADNSLLDINTYPIWLNTTLMSFFNRLNNQMQLMSMLLIILNTTGSTYVEFTTVKHQQNLIKTKHVCLHIPHYADSYISKDNMYLK